MARSLFYSGVTSGLLALASSAQAAVVLLDLNEPGLVPSGGQIYFDFEDVQPTGNTNSLTRLFFNDGNFSATLTRPDDGELRGFDIRDNTIPNQEKPFAWGDRSLSPFATPRDNSFFLVEFSAPVKSASVSFGDFGADSPDNLSLFALRNGEIVVEIVDQDEGQLITDVNRQSIFSAETLSVSDKDGFNQIAFIGGSASFPNSVFYDSITVARPIPFVLAKDTAKREELAEFVREEGLTTVATRLLVEGACVKLSAGACAAVQSFDKSLGIIGHASTFTQLTQIVNDPPRDDFDVLFDPNTIPKSDITLGLAGDEGKIADLALAAAVRQFHLLEGWLVTLERFEGAVLDGDFEAQEKQQILLEELIVRVSGVSSQIAQYSDVFLSRVLEGEPAIDILEINPNDRARLIADIEAQGFDQDERNILV